MSYLTRKTYRRTLDSKTERMTDTQTQSQTETHKSHVISSSTTIPGLQYRYGRLVGGIQSDMQTHILLIFCHFVFFYKGSLRGDAVAQLWTRPQASIIDASFDIEPRIIDLKTNGPTIVSMRLCLR